MDVRGTLFPWKKGRCAREKLDGLGCEALRLETLDSCPNRSLAMMGDMKAPRAKEKCRACMCGPARSPHVFRSNTFPPETTKYIVKKKKFRVNDQQLYCYPTVEINW